MKSSYKSGFSFGLTSGVITTLGLMVGLYSSVGSKLAIIGGILTIAVADAFSDALGLHVSKESERKKKTSIWETTFATFLAKFLIALTFVLPVLFLSLYNAIITSVAWGFVLLAGLSYNIAKSRNSKPWKAITEHLSIGIIVVFVTYFLGELIAKTFS